jgi:putative SOS response-associated peptidase YedK
MGRKPIVSGQHAAALTSMTLRRTWPTATGGLGSVVSGMAISFTSIRWNVAPTDNLPIVRYDAKPGSRTMDLMRWGLVPYWAKDIKIGFSTINAMAETVDTKPVFREAFQRRRCIVPVDNFYEWKKLGPKEKQPYAIALADRSLMALAGLWETWRSRANETVRSFTIVTTTPNELCGELHNRMPVILPPNTWPIWLGEEPAEPAELKSLLVPYTGTMVAWPVSQRVGNVRNNDASLVEPISV